MVEHNELITFFVAAGVGVFILFNWNRIKRIPEYRWLLAAYDLFFVGLTLALVEGFILPEVMSVLEHLSYMLSSVLAAAWCWFMLVRQEKES